MNQKGLLTAWNDANGFGFITPEGGGERVFAHISTYAGRGRLVSILAVYGGVSLVVGTALF